MKPQNIENLIDEIRACVQRHSLGKPGEYARWLWGENKNLGLNEYGVADAANILYSIGDFPRDAAVRQGFITTLQAMQDPATGMFSEPTHHTIHTTAHCTAALELFDAAPLYRCYALEKYLTDEGLHELLEKEVNWQKPWPQSHKGAGILPCLVNTGMADLSWKDRYFAWLWDHADPVTGFFYYGENGEPAQAPLFEYMAGGFHYLFNHEAEHRPMRYPEKIVDSCLNLMSMGSNNPANGRLQTVCTFIDVDVVYCLTRAMRQTPYRFYEGKAALEQYAETYLAMMNAIDYQNDDHFNDLHMLFGAVCCLAELQSALPGKIITEKPLKLVLDRRPFI